MPKPIKIVRWKGAAQMASRMNGHETGFAHIKIAQGEHYRDASAKHYYIIAVKYGAIQLTTRLYKDKIIGGYTMALAPKSGILEFTALEDTEVIMFAFTTTIIRTDDDMLRYFCSQAAKRCYTFTTLPLCDAMADFAAMITRQLQERKMKNSGVAQAWNSYFFHIMQSYYRKDEVAAFMRPIISGAVDFKAFVENNYLEADGNVAQLAALSGMSYDSFQDKFVRIYGTTAKQWLDERARQQLTTLAQTPHMTPQEMAAAMRCTPQKLNTLCQRYWGMAPGALIKNK